MNVLNTWLRPKPNKIIVYGIFVNFCEHGFANRENQQIFTVFRKYDTIEFDLLGFFAVIVGWGGGEEESVTCWTPERCRTNTVYNFFFYFFLWSFSWLNLKVSDDRKLVYGWWLGSEGKPRMWRRMNIKKRFCEEKYLLLL